jgi:hypothetical protein
VRIFILFIILISLRINADVQKVEQIIILYSSSEDHNGALVSGVDGFVNHSLYENLNQVLVAAKQKTMKVVLVDISDSDNQGKQLKAINKKLDQPTWLIIATHGGKSRDGEDTSLSFPKDFTYKELMKRLTNNEKIIGVSGKSCHGLSPYMGMEKKFFCSSSSYEKVGNARSSDIMLKALANIIKKDKSTDFKKDYKESFLYIMDNLNHIPTNLSYGLENFDPNRCFDKKDDSTFKVPMSSFNLDKNLFFKGTHYSLTNEVDQEVKMCSLYIYYDTVTEDFIPKSSPLTEDRYQFIAQTKQLPGVIGMVGKKDGTSFTKRFFGDPGFLKFNVQAKDDYYSPSLFCDGTTGKISLRLGIWQKQFALNFPSGKCDPTQLEEQIRKHNKKYSSSKTIDRNFLKKSCEDHNNAFQSLREDNIDFPESYHLPPCVGFKYREEVYGNNVIKTVGSSSVIAHTMFGQCLDGGEGFRCSQFGKVMASKACCTASGSRWGNGACHTSCIDSRTNKAVKPGECYKPSSLVQMGKEDPYLRRRYGHEQSILPGYICKDETKKIAHHLPALSKQCCSEANGKIVESDFLTIGPNLGEESKKSRDRIGLCISK